MRINLMSARAKKSINPNDMAALLNMTERMYRYIESGKRGTSEDNWIKIFNIFGGKYPLHELMENSER